MDDYKIHIVLILVFSIAILASKTYQYYTIDRVRKHLCWCATDRYERPIDFIYILNDLTTPAFRIGDKEKEAFFQILDEYRNSVIQTFLKSDRPNRKIAALDDKTFFLRTFYNFLDKRSCAFQISGNDMHTYICAINSYTTKYALTDFGVVYYKAYLATAIFAKSINEPFCDTNHIKEALETRELEIMCYTP